MSFKIEWIDRMREPQVNFNRDYPLGKDIVDPELKPGAKSCVVELEWPALRCGIWIVTCESCGLRIGMTTAGRVDDPRSITMACKR